MTIRLISYHHIRFSNKCAFSILQFFVNMSDSQDSKTTDAKSEIFCESNEHQNILNELELKIQQLEDDIRQQKKSSVNAKTSITFDQLRQIYNFSQILGPQKEILFDRICRAAEIQRASLKNRLKQNKDRFIHPNIFPRTPPLLSSQLFDSQSSVPDSQCCFATPNTLNAILHPLKREHELLAPIGYDEEYLKFPAERQYELLRLGFSYDELKKFINYFERFKNDSSNNTNCCSAPLHQILNLFSNHISISSPVELKAISVAFNLLELGNTLREVKRVLLKRRLSDSESDYDSKKLCNSPNFENSTNFSPEFVLDKSPIDGSDSQKS